ncbi:uncharacterized protein LOC129594667 [Paramacrobiotus metropolitanus]|uniref:uncharacterized protein LOC129594667 n=1 Tax=Paramacrobiotus metropolitanus TaxID=2943436 RepID=UPI002445CC78|nr:uncharacterized protein LOC129594667 [Paramacrobiotus metropolitanus]
MLLILKTITTVLLLPGCFTHDERPDLEIDCNPAPATTTAAPAEPTAFPFRTDLLTREECLAYAQLHTHRNMCSPVLSPQQCEPSKYDQYTITPPSRTYIDASCSWANRTALTEVMRSINIISPNRAAIVTFAEQNDTTCPIHSDVINPIRNQIIELYVLGCRTTRTTAKIYEAGIFPNLILYKLQSGLRLEIQKKHFTRMPQIRSIRLVYCTIAALEPYTFTDLPHLQSLELEGNVGYHLYRVHETPDRRIWDPEIFSDEDFEMIRKLHCDCSYAWYRNFLREKPYLTFGKVKGEIGVIGNYATPFVDASFLSGALSVNCTQKLTYNNSNVGSEYSYNVPCFNLRC